ncbi:hypothetical protein FF38_11182 [Lucilia cuprina]|uniref:Uncharacterized protein n=1 Tax=Lucilia cuprina TaxID=7375 RepID=A0A0L0BU30_LUCCU|nr:hypothetical protein FF38_11182 [Lucilia cuprina]
MAARRKRLYFVRYNQPRSQHHCPNFKIYQKLNNLWIRPEVQRKFIVTRVSSSAKVYLRFVTKKQQQFMQNYGICKTEKRISTRLLNKNKKYSLGSGAVVVEVEEDSAEIEASVEVVKSLLWENGEEVVEVEEIVVVLEISSVVVASKLSGVVISSLNNSTGISDELLVTVDIEDVGGSSVVVIVEEESCSTSTIDIDFETSNEEAVVELIVVKEISSLSSIGFDSSLLVLLLGSSVEVTRVVKDFSVELTGEEEISKIEDTVEFTIVSNKDSEVVLSE